MIDGIATVWLPVSDMDRALQFYSETLGLDIEEHQEDWSLVTAGAVSIGLNGRDEEASGGEGGAVIAFRPSDEIEDAVEALAAEGVEIAGGVTEHPWGKVATFRDPDGNELQLYESPDE
jgi:predicted enzyme related to lactoylglutathione lyase